MATRLIAAAVFACALLTGVGCARVDSPVAPSARSVAPAASPATTPPSASPPSAAPTSVHPVTAPASDHGFEFDAVAAMQGDGTGAATVRLSYRVKGSLRTLDVDRIELYSNGALGSAELYSFDENGTILVRKPADLSERFHGLHPKRDAARRPPDTVASAAVIYHGERAWHLYYVYHVVRVGEHSYQVVRQGFHSEIGEPRPEDQKNLNRLDLR